LRTEYDPLCLWDGDLAPSREPLAGFGQWEQFSFAWWFALSRAHGFGISQPLMTHPPSRVFGRAFAGVSVDDYPLGRRNFSFATVAGTEQMAPVYSARVWPCVWEMISARAYFPLGWGFNHVHRVCACAAGLQQYVVALPVTHLNGRESHTNASLALARRSYDFYTAMTAPMETACSTSSTTAATQRRFACDGTSCNELPGAETAAASGYPARRGDAGCLTLRCRHAAKNGTAHFAFR